MQTGGGNGWSLRLPRDAALRMAGRESGSLKGRETCGILLPESQPVHPPGHFRIRCQTLQAKTAAPTTRQAVPAMNTARDSRRIAVKNLNTHLQVLLLLALVVTLMVLSGCGAEEGRRARDLADDAVADSLEFAEGFCGASAVAPVFVGVAAIAWRRRKR